MCILRVVSSFFLHRFKKCVNFWHTRTRAFDTHSRTLVQVLALLFLVLPFKTTILFCVSLPSPYSATHFVLFVFALVFFGLLVGSFLFFLVSLVTTGHLPRCTYSAQSLFVVHLPTHIHKTVLIKSTGYPKTVPLPSSALTPQLPI